MKRTLSALLAAVMLFSLVGQGAAFADGDVLRLPRSVSTIEDEAFRGDTALDKVILPQQVGSIGHNAFAGSSLRQINLPYSLAEDAIASDAFDNTAMERVIVARDSGAAAWAEGHQQALGYTISYDNNLESWHKDNRARIDVDEGDRARLELEYSADDPEGIHFLWSQFDPEAENEDERWTPVIEGADGCVLTTQPIYTRQAYRCLVRDAYGFERGSVFEVYVNNDLRIWSTLENGSDKVYVDAGESAVLSVDAHARDESVLNFQWFSFDENDASSPLEGQTGKTLTVEAVSGTARYLCLVTDCYNGAEGFIFHVGVAPGEDAVSSKNARNVSATAAWVPLTYSITPETAENGYRMGVLYSENPNGLTVDGNNRPECFDWTWGRESYVYGPANQENFEGWLDELIPGRTYYYSGVILDNDGHVLVRETDGNGEYVVNSFKTGDGAQLTALTAGGEAAFAPRGGEKSVFRFTAETAGYYQINTSTEVNEISVRREDDRDAPHENDTNSVLFYADAGETVYIFTRDFNDDATVSLLAAEIPTEDSVSVFAARDISSTAAWIDFTCTVTPETAQNGYQIGIAFSRNEDDLRELNEDGRFNDNVQMWDHDGWHNEMAIGRRYSKWMDEFIPNTTYYYRAYLWYDDSVQAMDVGDNEGHIRSLTTGDGAQIEALTVGGEGAFTPRGGEKSVFRFTAETAGLYEVNTDPEVNEISVRREDDRHAAYENDTDSVLFYADEGETVYIFTRDHNDDATVSLHAVETPTQDSIEASAARDVLGTRAWIDFTCTVTPETAQNGYRVGIAFSRNPDDLDGLNEDGDFNCPMWDHDGWHNEIAVDKQYAKLIDELVPNTTYYYRAFVYYDGRVQAVDAGDDQGQLRSFTTDNGAEVQTLELSTFENEIWADFERQDKTAFRFVVPESGIYGIFGDRQLSEIKIMGSDGSWIAGQDNSDRQFVGLSAGDTVYLFVRDWDDDARVKMVYICPFAEEDSISVGIKEGESAGSTTAPLEVKYSVTDETAERGYQVGVAFCQDRSRLETLNDRGHYDCDMWDYDWYNIAVVEVPVDRYLDQLIPGCTYYYRAYILVDDRVSLATEIDEFTTAADDVPEMALDTFVSFSGDALSPYRFTAEEAGIYELVFDRNNENVDQADVRRASGWHITGNYRDEPIRFYLDEGETVYIFLRNHEEQRQAKLIFYSAAPAEDSIRTFIDTSGDVPVARITMDVTPELAAHDYDFCLEISASSDFTDPYGNPRSDCPIWEYGDHQVRSGDVWEGELRTLVPGATLYYRGVFRYEDDQIIYENEIHSLTVPGSAEDLTTLALNEATALIRDRDSLYCFTAPETDFYAVRIEGMYYCNLLDESGMNVLGTSWQENDRGSALLCVGLEEGERCFVAASSRDGGQVTVLPALGTIPALSSEAQTVWDNRYASFTAPETGWYSLKINRTDLDVWMNVYRGVGEPNGFRLDDEQDAFSLYLDEDATVYFNPGYDLNRGELQMWIVPVTMPDDNDVAVSGDVAVGDIWAEIPVTYSVTEDLLEDGEGYYVGVIYGSSEKLDREQDELYEEWDWPSRFAAANGETIIRRLDKLCPGTTYYFCAYLKDNRDGEIVARSDTASFTTEPASEALQTLSLDGEALAVPQGYSVYRFTPDEGGMYAVVSQGLNSLEIRSGIGHYVINESNDDWNNDAFAYRQGFIGEPGMTYYLYVYNDNEDVTISVRSGAQALPALTPGEWSEWQDGRQVYRFQVQAAGWYRFDVEADNWYSLKIADLSELCWLEPNEEEENRSRLVYLEPGEVYVGCWCDNEWVNARIRVRAVTVPDALSIETLDAADLDDISTTFSIRLSTPELGGGRSYRYGVLLCVDDGEPFNGGEEWLGKQGNTLASEGYGPLELGFTEEWNVPLLPDTRYYYQAFISIYDPATDSESYTCGELKTLQTEALHEGRTITDLSLGANPVKWAEGYQLFRFTVPENDPCPFYSLTVDDASIWAIDENGRCYWPTWTDDGLSLCFLGQEHKGSSYTVYLEVWNREGTELILQCYPQVIDVQSGTNLQLDARQLYRFTPTEAREYLIGTLEEDCHVLVISDSEAHFDGGGWGWITDPPYDAPVYFMLEREDGEETVPVTICRMDPTVTNEAELRQAAAEAASLIGIRPYFEFNIHLNGPVTLTQDLELCTAVQLHVNSALTVPANLTLTSRGDIYVNVGGSLDVAGTLELYGIKDNWWAGVELSGGTLNLSGTLVDDEGTSIFYLIVGEYDSTQAAFAAVNGLASGKIELVYPVTNAAALADVLGRANAYRYTFILLNEGNYDLTDFDELGTEATVLVSEGVTLTLPAGQSFDCGFNINVSGGAFTVAGTLNQQGWIGLNGGSFVNSGTITLLEGAGLNLGDVTEARNSGVLNVEGGAAVQLHERYPDNHAVVDNNGGTVNITGSVDNKVKFSGGTVNHIAVS